MPEDRLRREAHQRAAGKRTKRLDDVNDRKLASGKHEPDALPALRAQLDRLAARPPAKHPASTRTNPKI
jgi:hypothetical protein